MIKNVIREKMSNKADDLIYSLSAAIKNRDWEAVEDVKKDIQMLKNKLDVLSKAFY